MSHPALRIGNNGNLDDLFHNMLESYMMNDESAKRIIASLSNSPMGFKKRYWLPTQLQEDQDDSPVYKRWQQI